MDIITAFIIGFFVFIILVFITYIFMKSALELNKKNRDVLQSKDSETLILRHGENSEQIDKKNK